MPTFESSLSRSSNSGNNRVRYTGAPAGLQIGDGLLSIITYKNITGGISSTAPTGYTELFDTGLSYASWKIATQEDIDATFTDFLFDTGLSSEQGVLLRISDVDQILMVDNSSLVGLGASADPMNCPALSASRSARFYITGHSSSSFNRSGATHTGPVGWTERKDNTSFEIGLGVYEQDALTSSVASEAIDPSTSGNVNNHGGTIAVVGPLLFSLNLLGKYRRRRRLN